jgi:hypothetical protein
MTSKFNNKKEVKKAEEYIDSLYKKILKQKSSDASAPEEDPLTRGCDQGPSKVD